MRKQVSIAAIFIALVLAAGCTTATTTQTVYDANGRVTAKTVIEGNTEDLAAQGHRAVAVKAMEQLPALTTMVEIPRGYDKTGAKLEPAKLRVVDSGLYRMVGELANMKGYDSQAAKITKSVTGLLGKALQPLLTFGIVHEVVQNGTGATNTYNIENSMNDNKGSTAAIDSNTMQTINESTISPDQSADTTTTTETSTENITQEAGAESE